MRVQNWDLSNNALVGTLPPGGSSVDVSSLNFVGNPNHIVWPLPPWLQQGDQSVTISGSLYTCTTLVSSVHRSIAFTVDAASRLYNGCVCRSGLFGQPPLCAAVPQSVIVNPKDGFSSPEVGISFPRMINDSLIVGSLVMSVQTRHCATTFLCHMLQAYPMLVLSTHTSGLWHLHHLAD
jgi:hypothetical protein